MTFKKINLKGQDKNLIEPEEIILDVPLYNDPRNPKAYLETRLEFLIPGFIFHILFAIFAIGGLLVFYRPAALQISGGFDFLTAAEKNFERVYPIAASRGIIYDRNFQPLVENQPNFDLVVIPELLSDNESGNVMIIGILSSILDLPEEWFINFLNNLERSSTEAVPLVLNLTHEQVLKIEPKLIDIAGLRIEKNSHRFYTKDRYLAHVLGYTGRVNKRELATGDYFPTDYVGKAGIELIYDDVLRGRAGLRRFNVNAVGRVKDEVIISNSKSGSNLVLTLDFNLQEKIFNQFEAVLSNSNNQIDGAVAVALNPNNGEVLALVNWPSFDNNLFSSGISFDDFDELLNDPLKPLFNRAVSGIYPPGSSIKPLIALAALEEEVIDPKKQIFASGQIVIDNPYNPSQPSVFLDWKVHGLVDMVKAIANSANVYFYTIGGGYEDVAGLGIERIKEYSELFGLGQLTGIDLPAEVSGLIPTPQWKAANNKNNPVWRIGDTYHVSIGQGDLLVTPVQLVQLVGAIATDGRIYKPHLIKALIDENLNVTKSFSPDLVSRSSIRKDNFGVVKEGMKGTTSYGTASSFASLSFTTAGKTGTAQFGPNNSRTHSWMTVFAPFEEPEIALVILVEGGGNGATSAVPIAREVLRWYFDDYLKF